LCCEMIHLLPPHLQHLLLRRYYGSVKALLRLY
jgi:hypothetical protein